MIAVVVDTQLGNLRSVERAVSAAAQRAGLPGEVRRSSDPDVIARAPRLVVPGQGGFRVGASRLTEGLGEALLERLRAGTPYLGICLGLQLLFEASEEAPGSPGLGWFRGTVRHLRAQPEAKVPQVGWNQLELRHGGHRCLQAAGGEGAWLYFVHSYHAEPAEHALVKAVARHGDAWVTAAVAHEHVLATQFHPEKSQGAGLALLAEFLRL